MNVFVDLRCLQDENYAFRGVGYHSSVLLQGSRMWLPPQAKLIGLCDSSMPCLHDSHRDLVDECQCVFAPRMPREPSVYIQLSPMTHSPQLATRMIGRLPILSCAVVYDFIPFDMPDRYLATFPAKSDYLEQLGWLRSFDLFFPISEYSSTRLRELLCVPEESVHVTGVALRQAFEQHYKNSRHASNELGSNLNRYILCVAGADRRKNVKLLLQAHAKLKTPSNLVIVGKYPAGEIDTMREFYRAEGGKPACLKIESGLTDDELTDRYRNAVCSVCCSEIEGFSLPVLEAVACGSPILLSDNQAHRELVQTEQAYFQSHDVDGLSERLNWILSDLEARKDLLHQQCKMPSRFLGQKVCERFWLPILSQFQNHRRSVRLSSRATSSMTRDRVAVLSPFPPDASGVADYTRRTLESLGKHVDIDVYTDAVHPKPTQGVQNFFPISKNAYTCGQYDGVLSVVGNSHFHIKIIDLQRTYGGPCLVHDNRLSELYSWWKGPEYLADMATRSLHRKVSVLEAQHWVSNPGSLPSVFFDELIESAQPLIVHSRGIQSQCKKEYGREPEYLPFCVYRDFSEADLSHEAKQCARDQLGIPRNQFVIISLGIVGPSKAPNICIDAIKQLHQQGIKAHLYFVGSAGSMQVQLEFQARELGIAECVHLSQDWCSEKQYFQFVQSADFAIQLRNHFFGGLSGAMLDCIGSGLPTVANDDLAIALESPEYVLRVGDALVADEVAAQLLVGYSTALHLDRLKPSRQQYILDHSFDQYALQLLRVLGLEIRNDMEFPRNVRTDQTLRTDVTSPLVHS